ncbi:3397_t:CDS:2 [Funneliformis geosporum]|uniref:17458_t:CDS:1 n=1 Tax=Funneliformis geosporum TaxID=1117311 RepID=A0A9W4SPP8_9GLOM|nr:17458_t:CDS:2 [Funneliformis geosporum]CAI2181045.1 3397_t:CDS:2 [Funneliformis geosporum]
MSLQVDQISEKTQNHVPKWKKLLSLKNSSSALPIKYSQISTSKNEEETIIKLKTKVQNTDSEIIGKKRKKDKNKDKKSEVEKKKTNKHEKKKRKVNDKEKTKFNDIGGLDGNGNLSKQVPLEKTNDSTSVLAIEQTNLKVPDEFTHAAKTGLNYLLIWRYRKEEWKFQKVRQIWLLKNAYHEDLFSDDFFKVFIEYIAELSGKSRHTTLKMAQDIVNKFESEADGAIGEQEDDEKADQKDVKRIEQIKLNRAKAVVRVLS